MANLLLAVIYLAFISLGLPDSLLGSAWPAMFPALHVPVSYAGPISMIISAGTIVSSLASGRIIAKLGSGKVTAISIGMTAAAMFGFSVSGSYLPLLLFAIPYGLGAGCVDASLNHFVALHLSARHMNWLHCMWGVGASAGPYIMGLALTGGLGWTSGYRIIAIVQMLITALVVFSLPMWKRSPLTESTEQEDTPKKAVPLSQALRISGAREIMITFFCYCGLEQAVGLWAGSFLKLCRDMTPEKAAKWASLYYIGITVGRALCGFIANRYTDAQMIRAGCCVTFIGIALVAIPLGGLSDLVGLLVIGLGCAPIYPGIMHATPRLFGAENAQTFIGLQLASAYAGYLILPPLFGLLCNHISPFLFAPYIALILLLMLVMFQRTMKKCRTSGR